FSSCSSVFGESRTRRCSLHDGSVARPPPSGTRKRAVTSAANRNAPKLPPVDDTLPRRSAPNCLAMRAMSKAAPMTLLLGEISECQVLVAVTLDARNEQDNQDSLPADLQARFFHRHLSSDIYRSQLVCKSSVSL